MFTANKGSIIAHRFQVKLGQSELTRIVAEEITTKLNTGKTTVEAMVKRLNSNTNLQFAHYLITTRPIATNAQIHLANKKVTLLDGARMLDIWADDIRKWDTDAKIFVYSKKP